MMRMTFLFIITLAISSLTSSVCSAQASGTNDTCEGPVYDRKEVTIPAKITRKADLQALYQAFGYGIQLRIVLDAILCRSGQVTDLKVVDSSDNKMNQFVVAAMSQMGFKPAEMNWHTVSQKQRFEFQINYRDPGISPTAAENRLIEDLDIIGNRRLVKDDILSWIKMRPGEPYKPEQVENDLKALLATGQFDALGTRLIIEDASRGGVRVIFEVMELPLIKEIKIEGIKKADQAAILEELRKPDLNLDTESPLDSLKLKKATRAIEVFLSRSGWLNAKAEAFVENISATEVTITFRVSGYNFRS